MFNGDKLRIIAASLVVLVATGLAWFLEPKSPSVRDPEPESEQQWGSYEGTVTCNADCQISFGFSDGGTDNRHQESNASSDSADQRSLKVGEADLLAQERMAYWTRVVGVFTAAGLAILYITFGAARDAVVETRKIGEAQTRGYLVMNPKFVSFDADDVIWFGCELSAIGNSPLMNVTVSRQYFFFGNSGRETLGDPGIKSVSNDRGHTLVPGHKPVFDGEGLRSHDLIARLCSHVGSHPRIITVWVEVHLAWLDVFRREHAAKYEVEAWFMSQSPHTDIGPSITRVHPEKTYERPRYEKWEPRYHRWERRRQEKLGLIPKVTMQARLKKGFNRFRGWVADPKADLFV